MIWRKITTAPKDNFVNYRLADGTGHIRGCIDRGSPEKVWVPDINSYRPLVDFDGWQELSYEPLPLPRSP